MKGIFHLFDWPQMGISGRRLLDQCNSRTLQCHSLFTDGGVEEEFSVSHQHQSADMKSNKNAAERQRSSTESSKASFSSSRSSSFSSVDYCRGTQPDPAYKDRITFSEAVFDDSQHSVSPRIARKSAEFRDIVKDSMLKEARGLSIKTTSRQSSEVSAKQKGAEWAYNELKEQRKMADHGYRSKDVSHTSYDRIERSRLSFDSREALSAFKLRDSPRLSLDGREFLTRRVECDSLSHFQLDTSLKRSYSTKEKGRNLIEVSVTQQQRSPSVIAKLMGLTTLPDSSTLATQNDRSLIRTHIARDDLDAYNPQKPILDSKPSTLQKVPDSARWITSEMKPISNSRIPVEQAPWKNQEKGISMVRQSPRRIKSPIRQSNPIPSVYSEIEKRFKDIEFNQSGKDLRALKQILESIHAKGLLEDEKQEQATSDLATGGEQESTIVKLNRKNSSVCQQNAQGENFTEVFSRHYNSHKPNESQIVIMKQTTAKSNSSKNMFKEQVVGSFEKCGFTQYTGRPQQPKDNSASSPRNLGSISPRIRIKMLESEKQNQFPSHSSDANRLRLQVSKEPTESSSPSRKVQPRLANKQQIEIKKLSQTNEETLPADIIVALDSRRGKDATRTVQSYKVNGSHSPSRKSSKQVVLASNKSLNQISLPVKQDATAPGHPSPVSVLNISPYTDDSSTEEKQLATPPEELAEGSVAFIPNLSSEVAIASEISRKKLLSIDSLVHKLKQLNSTHDESKTDYIALLCENTNPDHRYISEILLASGLLLREFSSDAKPFQLDPSEYLINPELFKVLEQTKSSPHTSIVASADEPRSHRKLIFDTVNEILTKKVASNGSFTFTARHHHRLDKKLANTQNLVKELCAEIEQMQPKKNNQENKSESDADTVKGLLWEDVMHRRSDRWNAFEGVSEVVLDIERSLFKKLVSEIVINI